jgi:two-component system, cell cycle sensor histidine kinase and response regulator CckA
MPRFGIDNQLGGLIHIVRDVTERKRAEAERERLMAAIEQAGEVVLITDPEGTIQYVNPAFEAVTGYTREEAIGQNPRILKSGRQDKAFYRKLWETISSGRTWEGRIVNKRKDGTIYTETANISPVRNPAGRIVNFVAVKRDITEHLNMEEQFQQAQKMESVGRLAGGVAHDFNNMLGIILGYAEIALYEAGHGTPLHDNLMEIRRAAQRSADLTRQLLAFARKQTIDPKVLDLNGTIEGTLRMLRRLIGEDIDLAWLPGADLWPVKMDPAQLDQILANLCVNARDAIAGVGKVTIETENALLDEVYCAGHAGFAPGEYVMLAVSDNGCGMDEQSRKRLFEPFFTTKEIGKGTGLGLSTVYGIVRQNDGFINVYSEPGQGTSFKIYLPRHAAGIVETSAARPAELQQGHGETVLLVEDEPTMLNMGKGMLEKLGYTVLTADIPREAMHLAVEHTGTIDLLMTDVVMPEMNGRELAERLLQIKPGMKCLFMSGYTANVIAHHGVLDQGLHFIQKPFTIKELAAKVRKGLDG